MVSNTKIQNEYFYLSRKVKDLDLKVCCLQKNGGGGGSVVFQNSATIEFTGAGTSTNPYIANYIGGAGTGTVKSVNTILPDSGGNVTLTAINVNATPDPVTDMSVSIRSGGNWTTFPVQTLGTDPDSIVMRITGGQIIAGNPVRSDAVTTKNYVDTALALKAPINSPTFTGTVSGITKAMVGLANVDNTSDVNKPVSTAQQTALNLKANLASPTLTGTPAAPTASLGTNTTQIATTAFVQAAIPTTVVATTMPSDISTYPDGTLFIIG